MYFYSYFTNLANEQIIYRQTLMYISDHFVVGFTFGYVFKIL